jgi:PHD/YefM family antitoxin component YafN of YafNO toxin-antitoxin module
MLRQDFVVDTKGKKKAVIFSIEKYEQLMEDLHDLAIVAERRKEEVVSFDEMKRRLKKNGVL